MGFFLIFVLGLLGWLGVSLVVDRASIPAHKSRDAYRTLAAWLIVGLIFCGYKVVQYRSELRALITVCH